MSFKKLVLFALFSLILIGGSMWLWRAYEARNGVVADESASEESKGTDMVTPTNTHETVAVSMAINQSPCWSQG